MRYLRKSNKSRILAENWHYKRKKDRTKIRSKLLKEQHNFCAYSEYYIQRRPIDADEIEHFDETKKNTADVLTGIGTQFVEA